MMKISTLERRGRRSSFAGEALNFQLEHVCKEQNLVALVLADPSGLLIASSRPGPEAEELAAVAPFAARRASLCPQNPISEEKHLPCAVGEVSVDDSPLILLAVGERRRARVAIASASLGVRRILATQLAC
jgi:hypothetical protein